MQINIGDKFGLWEVVGEPLKKNGKWYHLCRCSCDKHTERYVQRTYLVTGKSTSCGCRNRVKKNEGMVGKKFGKLTVLKQMPSSKFKNIMWECLCECGNKTVVAGFKLRNGHTKSCGHCNHVGEIINGVEILEQIGGAWFKCKCPYCGNEFTQQYNRISSGHVRSCGCQANHKKDMLGKTFGNWRVISATDKPTHWLCECMCEKHTKRVLNGEVLRLGISTSCGCLSHSINFIGSTCENEIKDYISTLTSEAPLKTKILDGKEIDLYYPQHNIGIEYNGSVYHATINALRRDVPKYYHRDKFLLAKEKGIHLITIFDVDWKSNKERIKMYLKDVFSPKIRLYARKCVLKVIDKPIANGFCDKYHLQGGSRLSKIHLGLYYNNELCSVMTFGRQRRKKDSNTDFELIRYCVRSGYTIVGGAEKLLKHFITTYSPKDIVSYSDNDYFAGGVYEKLGFSYDSQTTVSYYWYNHDVKINREQCQLSKLKVKYPKLVEEAYTVKASNKEDYVMTRLGACKVFRCGNTKWVLDKLN